MPVVAGELVEKLSEKNKVSIKTWLKKNQIQLAEALRQALSSKFATTKCLPEDNHCTNMI